ncbi:uncharacterized protein BJ171DRAFT_476998 [Polychytrium aggregatum]|uniref:uncharacterized protein n=1 Tax=Polychytrium aggregatum TaxID=110093 RepID=UPI0022FE2B77|nr:uncharacterized protein BJ171DRAFT_476998 [Polychytrium aggregatum]KAI9202117.1 hypothetical protein BJ171DRAFT_476998 [Polychytrium aggregatum]
MSNGSEGPDAEHGLLHRRGSCSVAVEPHLRSRLLYPNPVCLLTTTHIGLSSSGTASQLAYGKVHLVKHHNPPIHVPYSPQPTDPAQDAIESPAIASRNVMTISWLTPIDNNGNLVCSIKTSRHSKSLLLASGYFVLNVPVHGMEDLIVQIGSCSGSAVDKFDHLNLPVCLPGWAPSPPWPWSTSSDTVSADLPAQPVSNVARKSRRSKEQPGETMPPLVALADCVAHLVCRVDDSHERLGHLICYASIRTAFVQKNYWNGRTFAGPLDGGSGGEILSFLGTKTFARIVPVA